VAAQLGTRARGTLESIALSKLAAAVVLPRASAPARSTLDALAAGEREARRCRCRDSVPASAFFRWHASTGAVDVAVLDSSGVNTDLIAAAARSDASRPATERSPEVHLVANRALGNNAIVTLAERDANGGVGDVYGFVID